ncbi:troponin C-like [Rhopilema esculentum]|uniref:troponin C-like n=1 Tax=Rhopilema esculentum TaxID=499914 RepID=UPI0031DF80BE
MGIRPSFPIKHETIYFESPANYTSFGTRRAEELVPLHTSLFHQLHEPFWKDLVCERKIDLEARRKFYDMGQETIKALSSRFSDFKSVDIQELRFQFQCFDINGDGLIDKSELMHVLDDMGDKSDAETREQCFLDIDEDGSGAIDFEEFLGLIYQLKNEYGKDKHSSSIAVVSKNRSDKVKALCNLSIEEQLENGLF